MEASTRLAEWVSILGGILSSVSLAGLVFYRQWRETKRLEDLKDEESHKESLQARLGVMEKNLRDAYKTVKEKDKQLEECNNVIAEYKLILKHKIKGKESSIPDDDTIDSNDDDDIDDDDIDDDLDDDKEMTR